MAHRYTILALLSFSTLINYLDRQALAVVVPELRRDLALSSRDYGEITTAFLIAYGAGQLLAGPLIDRLGAGWGLALFAAVWSLAALAHGLAQTAGHLLALRILLGLGEAGNWPAGVKSISERFSRSERAFSMGLFDAGSAIGAMLAPPLVATLTIVYGWRVAFLCTGVLGLLWLILWLGFMPREAPLPALSPGASWRMLRGRPFWGLVATRFLATPVWWFHVFWLPDYLGQARGFTLREIGVFAWVPFVTVDLGKLFGGRLSDYWILRGASVTRARKVVMGGGAVCMAAGLLVVDAHSSFAALAWVSLATFGFGMWSANILALHADLFASRGIATAVGGTTAAASLGGAIFTWLTGRLVDTEGYGLVFALAGTAALLGFAVLWFTIRDEAAA
ncbi:MAG: MFS transporter [Bryobacteraceae bacterium]|nr:MFS transporter [Bryobacteraceae bacterium]